MLQPGDLDGYTFRAVKLYRRRGYIIVFKHGKRVDTALTIAAFKRRLEAQLKAKGRLAHDAQTVLL